jgi:hypothetical protein
MKTTSAVIICTFVLTLTMYVLAYYFLPTPPSSDIVVLFAGVAAVFVLIVQWVWRKARAKKSSTVVVLLFCIMAWSCGVAFAIEDPGQGPINAAQMSQLCLVNSGPLAGTTIVSSSPMAVGSPCRDGTGNSGLIIRFPAAAAPVTDGSFYDGKPAPNEEIRRATGTAPLMRGGKEEPGFGLYSYALISRVPQQSEKPRYLAFLAALFSLASADDIARALTKNRINVTYVPVTSLPPANLAVDAQAEYALDHYDYARSTAMLANLPNPTGEGPILVSVITPLSLTSQTFPVLVQDLSKAQQQLMTAYTKEFADQVANEKFWEPETLELLEVNLENVMVVAAGGVGMTESAVSIWLRLSK